MQATDQSLAMMLTFHYENGHSEAFSVLVSPETAAGRIQQLLSKSHCIFQIADQTVMINMATVVKVEVVPPLEGLQGDEVFAIADRVTALTRSNR